MPIVAHSKALHHVGTVCSAILDQRREILFSDRRRTARLELPKSEIATVSF